MTKTVSRKAVKKGRTEDVKTSTTKQPAAKSQKKQLQHQQKTSRRWMIGIVILCLLIGAVVVFLTPSFQLPSKGKVSKGKNADENKKAKESKGSRVDGRKQKKPEAQKLPEQFKDFKLSVQSKLQMKNLQETDHEMKIRPLTHDNSKSSVRAYVIENFLSDVECNSLAMVHSRHVTELNKQVPIICFDSIKSFREYLKEAKLKIKVSLNDFTKGTTCINETFSAILQPHFKWSYSTAFYPGESKFSTMFAERIRKASGLKLENGGKFQITSYPQNIGYKNHTDCVVEYNDKRDRFATILVYLRDVKEGGETKFPQLGISVKPRKGLALIWNSMNSRGECDPTSLHNAAKVIKGHKFIIQRWYYYHNFPALGKRPQQPLLPQRAAYQPRVACDEYEQGSCRWYDEWNYDHIVDYTANIQNLI
ncbi:hypothetical protein ACROYT_G025251 [Oculina patagonica]